jgi:hypothetical protein
MKEQNSPVTHAPIILNDNDSDAQMQGKKKREQSWKEKSRQRSEEYAPPYRLDGRRNIH